MDGPIIPYPDGINGPIATVLYGHVIGEYDDIFRFDESDAVSNLWLSYATLHNRYPRLEDVVFVVNGPAMHIYSDGSVITDLNGDVAYL